MDLAFTAEEQDFAAEVRAWLAANLAELAVVDDDAPLEQQVEWGRAWQARLAADRWVGIAWPAAYGGRGATPVEVALFNMEYARAGAPQPVNRVGINLAGPTLLAHGTEDQRARWLPRILDASELWCQLFSEPGAGSDLAVAHHPRRTRHWARTANRAGSVSGQKVWTSYAQFARWGIGLVRTDPEAAEAPRHLVPRRRHAGAGCGGAAAAADDRGLGVQRGVPRRGVRAGRAPGRCAPRWLGGGRHDAGPRARHELPVQGAGRPRDLPRRAVVRGGPAGPARRPRGGRRPGRRVRRAAPPAPAQLAHALPPRPRPRARPRVELGEAGVDGHDPRPVGDRARRARPRAPRCGAAGRASSSGRTRRRSPAAPPRSRRASSANASSACRAEEISGW